MHNLCAAAGLRHNTSRSRRPRRSRRRRSRTRRSTRARSRRRSRRGHNGHSPRRPCRWSSRSSAGSNRRHHRTCSRPRRRHNHRRRTRLRRTARLRLSLLALHNRLQRIARLRDVRQVEARLRLSLRARSAAAAPPILQIPANLLRLICLDRARVGLRLRHANSRQRVQNGPALYLKLSCQIIDSNFVHPSLFLPLRASCSYQPHRRRSYPHCYYPRNRELCDPETLPSAADSATHGRDRPHQSPRRRPPAPDPPTRRSSHSATRSAPSAHPHP